MNAARIHPDARSDYLTVFPDARCRREPLLRKRRELAQARKLGLIGDAPHDPDTIPEWKTLADLALGFAFWLATLGLFCSALWCVAS